MKDEESRDSSDDPRQRAEEVARLERPSTEEAKELFPEAAQKTVHELRVHQIELETQNEELRRTQELLVESLEKYSDLYDFAPVGYFTLNAEGLILEANLTGAGLLRVDRRRIIGKPFQRFLEKNYSNVFFHYKQKIVESRKKLSCELKLKRDNDTIFDAQLEGRALEDADGTLRRWRMIVSDITDRKKAEEQLRLSAERLRDHTHMLEQAQILVKDMDNRIVYWTEGAERLYGFTKSQAIGRVGPELLRTELGESPEKVRVQLLLTGKWEGEFHHKKADGETIIVASHVVLVRDADGEPQRIIKADNDITDRKRAEEALRESEQLCRAVFESTGDCIYLKDSSLRFKHVNTAMCELLELPAEAILGRKAEDIFGEDLGRIVNEREARVLQGESLDLEHSVKLRGTVMTFHDSVVPLRNLDGDIVGVYSLSRNITDRRMASAEPAAKDRTYPSTAMQSTFHDAHYAAKSDGIILLLGESGSGKDFLARWIHDRSGRSNGPFFTLNCAAVPTELAESELFGYERGAFTGAQGSKRGMLELAEGGTILLNEIGELSTTIQAKLLAFLDTRSFVRVGGQKSVHVNARLIAATHRDLREEVEEKRFLEPLFYRLSVFPIRVPSLRERMEDLPILVEEIMDKVAREMQLTEVPIVDSTELELLKGYSWPGNVRELRNLIERSLMLWNGGSFSFDFPRIRPSTSGWSHLVRYLPDEGLQDVIEEVAYSLCEHVLRATGGNKKEAAKSLKISRDTLYRYLKKMERRRKNRTHDSSLSENSTP